MTVDELTHLTERLLSGDLTRPAVAELANARLPGPYYPTRDVQPPSVQLELMLLNAALPTEPHEPGQWWFRDTDFTDALAELHGSTEELPVGDGWRQVRIWPEGTRIQWELAVDGPPEMLTARGARLLRHVSDPGLAERADLISPSGQRVSMIWPHRWDDHQSGGMLAVGDAPPEIGVPEILTLLRVDLDSTFVSLRHLAVELDLAVLVPSTHRVLGLDDNGNTFRVGRYATRAAAEAVARHFEDLGHKQSYWTEPA